MDKENTNLELEILRQQMQVLKDKLETQEIVNDRMVIRSMKKEMSWLKKYVYIQFALIPIVAIVWYFLKYALGLSWWNYAALNILCIISVYYSYKINLQAINEDDYHRCNLIETVQKLIIMKRQRTTQILIEMVAILGWFAWTGLEMRETLGTLTDELHIAFINGGFIGGTIGGVIGIIVNVRNFYKMQRINDNMIEQINELVSL